LAFSSIYHKNKIMAKQTQNSTAKIAKPKKKRKGVHSKCKSSKSKGSKLYTKKYNGQGSN